MPQSWIKATFYRGGTSKGVFFHARDLPADRDACSRIFLDVIGSPDANGRQLDGMGGGISSLSKAVIIGPPTHPDADVDYTFIQLAVDKPVADWKGNCGNLSSAVGPFAIDEGLMSNAARRRSSSCASIRSTPTGSSMPACPSKAGGRRSRATTQLPAFPARAPASGSIFSIPAARSPASCCRPARCASRSSSPGTQRRSTSRSSMRPCRSSMSRRPRSALTGAESPDEIEAKPGVMALLDQIRREAGVRIGQGATPEAVGLQLPRVAVVAAPVAFTSLDGQKYDAGDYDIATRMISMERAHRAIPGTGGLNLGVAARIEGTIPHGLARSANAAGEIRVGNPSGLVSVGAEVACKGGVWRADSAVLFRTARRLCRARSRCGRGCLERGVSGSSTAVWRALLPLFRK